MRCSFINKNNNRCKLKAITNASYCTRHNKISNINKIINRSHRMTGGIMTGGNNYSAAFRNLINSNPHILSILQRDPVLTHILSKISDKKILFNNPEHFYRFISDQRAVDNLKSLFFRKYSDHYLSLLKKDLFTQAEIPPSDLEILLQFLKHLDMELSRNQH